MKNGKMTKKEELALHCANLSFVAMKIAEEHKERFLAVAFKINMKCTIENLEMHKRLGF